MNLKLEGTGEHLSCECDLADTIGTLKEFIAKSWRLQTHSIIVSYNGRLHSKVLIWNCKVLLLDTFVHYSLLKESLLRELHIVILSR